MPGVKTFYVSHDNNLCGISKISYTMFIFERQNNVSDCNCHF